MITTTLLQNVLPFFFKNDEIANNSINSPNKIQLLTLRYMIVLGFSLCLCSVVFFFAFNWQIIPDWTKFSLIQTAFVITVFLSFRVGLNSFLGKSFLSSACLLVGVFFAVFGQIYQTGADSYVLFLGWAVAISPFVLISAFSGLWLFWIALINLTIILYFDSAFTYLKNEDQVLLTVLSCFNGFILILREVFQSKFSWINTLFSRYVVFLFLQLAIAGELLYSIHDEQISFYTVISFILSVCLYVFFRYKCLDFFIIAFCFITNATLCIIYILSFSSFNSSSYVLISLICILFFGAISLYIDFLYKKINKNIIKQSVNGNDDSLMTQGEFRAQNVVDFKETDESVTKIDKDTTDEDAISDAYEASNIKPIPNPFKAYSFIQAAVCAISSLITVGFVFLFLVLLYMSEFDGALFMPIMATICLTLTLILHIKYKNNGDIQSIPYILIYQMLTTLLLAYALLTFFAYELSLSLKETALLFGLITAIIYPFIANSVSRILTLLYSTGCIFISICAIPYALLTFNAIALIAMTLGFVFETKCKALNHLGQALFIGFFVQNTILLSDFLFFLEYSPGNDFYTSILFAVFCFIFYVLAIIKSGEFYKSFSALNVFCHGLALFAVFTFIYFHAFPVLYIMGMFIFSFYVGKILLLKCVMLFSISILSQYYYVLNVNLLYKSYTLLIAGLILLLFCFAIAVQQGKAIQGKDIYEK